MHLKKILFYLIMGQLVLAACSTVPKSLHEPVSKSPFIFKGTVQELNASTIETSDSNNLMIVNVDEILEATDEFEHLEGQKITIEDQNMDKHAINDTKGFVTDRWIFGKSIAVRNLGDFEVKDDQPRLMKKIKAKINKVKQQDDQKSLEQRLKQARLVFSGEVMATKSIPATGRGALSEHNPEWTEARVKVTRAFKGLAKNQTEITIVFPNSMDVMWFNVPKFKEKDTGVWILEKKESLLRKSATESNRFIMSTQTEFTNDAKMIEEIQKILN